MGKIVWLHNHPRERVSKCGRWLLFTLQGTRQWCVSDKWTGAHHWAKNFTVAAQIAEDWANFFELYPAMQQIAELLKLRKEGVW